jgi:tRNA pseudouridine38-40 synthase
MASHLFIIYLQKRKNLFSNMTKKISARKNQPEKVILHIRKKIEMPYRYFLSLSFDGSSFFGWQRQAGNLPTVQKLLEQALEILLRSPAEVTGAGRTDTAVHARIFYAHFDSATPVSTDLTYRLNRILPPQIAIHNITQVNNQAHARFSAVSRTYTYRICTRKDPFEIGRSWHFEQALDLEKMQSAADMLLGRKDFGCFSKSNTQVKTNICQVMSAKWSRKDHIFEFEITADRFLRNMVRAIVGTLVDVGLGKLSLEEFPQILESRNRSMAGYSAPGCGLFLSDISYPEEVWII